MLFNSLEFAVFLPLVFVLYWSVTKLSHRNIILLVSSYVFYGWWDWRFLSLIVISSIVDYNIGLAIEKSNDRKLDKRYLLLSLLVNLGMLGFFKYYNFFLDSFEEAFTLFGSPISASRLNIILPVGISFYTFQTLSYTIDIYREKIKPTKSLIQFFTFVSFFPQLVAGPIERASNLLPQFKTQKKFKYEEGIIAMRQILWGLFKKVVIADTCAIYVNDIFSNYQDFSGGTLILGTVLFAFQIYGDFSGYSDIAIGTAKLFGFNLMQNFAFPYFSRDIAEFWRRWHISLSTWFRDYLYIPLGGSRKGTWGKVRNTFIIFIVSGFWHGANWTFVMWGFVNALFFLPLLLLNKNRRYVDEISPGRFIPAWHEALNMFLTFGLACLAWIFFRCPDITTSFDYIHRIFSSSSSKSIFETTFRQTNLNLLVLGINLLVFLFIEWVNRNEKFGLSIYPGNQIFRYMLYFYLLDRILHNFSSEQTFIYFQF